MDSERRTACGEFVSFTRSGAWQARIAFGDLSHPQKNLKIHNRAEAKWAACGLCCCSGKGSHSHFPAPIGNDRERDVVRALLDLLGIPRQRVSFEGIAGQPGEAN